MNLECLDPSQVNEYVKRHTKLYDFPTDQYYPVEHDKSQVVLHHTVSNGSNASGDISYWLSSKARVSTSMLITENGIIHQVFDPKYWGHALGCKRAYLKPMGFKDYLQRNKLLNQQSVQIEIDSLGPVTIDGVSVAYGAGHRADEWVEYQGGYRGYEFFEKYSDRALESTFQVLRQLTEVYDISRAYNDDMWDVSMNALSGKSGIWTHTSYRKDKSDCHPQKELIEMLQAI